MGFSLSISHLNRFFPRTTISGINIGGMTKEEAINVLEEEINNYQNQSIALNFEDKNENISIKEFGIDYNPEATANSVFKQTHSGFFTSIINSLNELFFPRNWKQVIQIKKLGIIQEKITLLAQEGSIEAEDAKLEIINDSIIFTESKEGFQADRKETLNHIKKNLSLLKNESIEIIKKPAKPAITDIDLAQAYFKTSLLLQNRGFKINRDGNLYYFVDSEDLKGWLKFERKSYLSHKELDIYKGKIAGVSISSTDQFDVFLPPQIIRQDEKIEAFIDEEKISSFVESLAFKLNKSPKNAILTIEGGAVSVLKKEIYGQELDKEKLLEEINLRLNSSSNSDLELPLSVVVPAVRSNNIEGLGIKDKIATGVSSFSGSPDNRIHNLTLGASKFNNVLVKPGEVASFSKIVGSVEASDGYLPELVIKGKQTIQEYGGGMCQVSTTLYRAALNAGLPIIERRPHAYLVGYYKDGPDATVYVPSTDLKFKNDTDYYILIQTSVSGKNMYFEFWGTPTGRKVEISAPQFIDPIPAPAEPYYIDDPSYPQGYEKMEEHPHQGVTGIIYRIITYPDGKVKKEEIKSVYKPWPAKIRRGTGPADLPIPSPTP